MQAKRIIPCLDVKSGRVVKGINFLELRDAGDPVEQAQIYDEQGADEFNRISAGAGWRIKDNVELRFEYQVNSNEVIDFTDFAILQLAVGLPSVDIVVLR